MPGSLQMNPLDQGKNVLQKNWSLMKIVIDKDSSMYLMLYVYLKSIQRRHR